MSQLNFKSYYHCKYIISLFKKKINLAWTHDKSLLKVSNNVDICPHNTLYKKIKSSIVLYSYKNMLIT